MRTTTNSSSKLTWTHLLLTFLQGISTVSRQIWRYRSYSPTRRPDTRNPAHHSESTAYLTGFGKDYNSKLHLTPVTWMLGTHMWYHDAHDINHDKIVISSITPQYKRILKSFASPRFCFTFIRQTNLQHASWILVPFKPRVALRFGHIDGTMQCMLPDQNTHQATVEATH